MAKSFLSSWLKFHSKNGNECEHIYTCRWRFSGIVTDSKPKFFGSCGCRYCAWSLVPRLLLPEREIELVHAVHFAFRSGETGNKATAHAYVVLCSPVPSLVRLKYP